jgi:hypothetical protein
VQHGAGPLPEDPPVHADVTVLTIDDDDEREALRGQARARAPDYGDAFWHNLGEYNARLAVLRRAEAAGVAAAAAAAAAAVAPQPSQRIASECTSCGGSGADAACADAAGATPLLPSLPLRWSPFGACELLKEASPVCPLAAALPPGAPPPGWALSSHLSITSLSRGADCGAAALAGLAPAWARAAVVLAPAAHASALQRAAFARLVGRLVTAAKAGRCDDAATAGRAAYLLPPGALADAHLAALAAAAPQEQPYLFAFVYAPPAPKHKPDVPPPAALDVGAAALPPPPPAMSDAATPLAAGAPPPLLPPPAPLPAELLCAADAYAARLVTYLQRRATPCGLTVLARLVPMPEALTQSEARGCSSRDFLKWIVARHASQLRLMPPLLNGRECVTLAAAGAAPPLPAESHELWQTMDSYALRVAKHLRGCSAPLPVHELYQRVPPPPLLLATAEYAAAFPEALAAVHSELRVVPPVTAQGVLCMTLAATRAGTAMPPPPPVVSAEVKRDTDAYAVRLVAFLRLRNSPCGVDLLYNLLPPPATLAKRARHGSWSSFLKRLAEQHVNELCMLPPVQVQGALRIALVGVSNGRTIAGVAPQRTREQAAPRAAAPPATTAPTLAAAAERKHKKKTHRGGVAAKLRIAVGHAKRSAEEAGEGDAAAWEATQASKRRAEEAAFAVPAGELDMAWESLADT